jgi:hydrogenase maturation protease
MESERIVCLVGIGNSLRSDDGIGAHICAVIEEMKIPGVTVLTTHQLQLEMIEDLLDFEQVILVDASLLSGEFEFYPFSPEEGQGVSSSHHVNAHTFGTIAKKIYNDNFNLYICAVKGENFELGEQLSTFAMNNTKKAIDFLVQWLNNHTQ